MKIPIFKLKFEDEFITEFKKRSEEILRSNRPLAEEKYVGEFEKHFAKLVKAKYALAVTNGTAAIELALKSIGVREKTVFLPANTFFATTVAVTNASGNISLVDIEEDSFSLSPQSLEANIKNSLKNKERLGAVIIVHIGGIISANISDIVRICNKYKIPLIEDAAHAHASSFGKFKAGTIGRIGCFSFFPTKVMTSGEGGMITTNDKKIFEYLRSIKNFGRDNNDHNLIINPDGNNFKVTELTGLLGYMECKRVIKRIAKRNELVNVYISRLKGSSYVPILQKKGLCSYYKMILKTTIDTKFLKDFCKKNEISLTGEVYKIPINKQPLYKNLFKNQSFPVSNYVSNHHICPPLYPELSKAEVNYICDVLLKAEKQYEK